MDLLPKVESEFIEEAPAPLKEEEESDDEEVEVLHESIVPEVEKKVVIPEETIFVEKKVKKELSVTPIKQDKRKRVMTEEQLERLRIGREKGLAKRRAAAAEKKEIKELTTKKKKKDIQKLREEVEDKPAPAPAPAPVKKSYTSLDDLPQDLLIKLQEQAIEGYDTKRKARKAKKKEAESKQSELSHFQSMVTNAVNPKQPARYGEPGFFNHLF
tara:strand:+ start:1062 stop:1703 length:642 start_codon:yes stop_codon:yes gene_type:complete